MSHRAQQIVDAAEAALNANANLGATVLKNHSLSVSAPDNELPCVNISPAADTPLSELGAVNVAFIDSLLTLEVLLVARAPDEPSLLAALIELRRQTHIALISVGSLDLGLSFVMGLRYGGAEAPRFNTEGQQIAGAITTRWHVLYRMNIADPA